MAVLRRIGSGFAAALTACAVPAMSGSRDPKPLDAVTQPHLEEIGAGQVRDKVQRFDAAAHLYLEDVEGERALADVQRWNARTVARLENDPRFAELERAALEIENSPDRISSGAIRGDSVYNFWQGEQHTRGLWRQSDVESYLAGTPQWKTLLDIDALAREENRNWVFKRAKCLPGGDLCMIGLSDGGKDAVTMREFDISKAEFVADGFQLPEAKTGLVWVDADTLLVASDWGEGTLTDSGYPFVVRLLIRGRDPARAREVLRGDPSDVGVWPAAYRDENGEVRFGAVEAETFYTSVHWVFTEGFGSAPRKLPIPPRARARGLFSGGLFVQLNNPWQGDGRDFPSGALVALDWQAFLAGDDSPPVATVFTPGEGQALHSVSVSGGAALITVNDNVARRIVAARRDGDGGWRLQNIPLPEDGTARIEFADPDERTALVLYEDFLTPDTLWALDSSDGVPTRLQSLPAWFDASRFKVEQRMAVSADGTSIPYYVIAAKQGLLPGEAPTLLYGYGGFRVSLNPYYSGQLGRMWLEQGGAFVLANIRGGGEFGPAWHAAGLKTKRQRIYDDFIAVAEDLIDTGLTRPGRLGIKGGSNGGLLVGAMYVQRPDLWHAIICNVPLLDMLRYHLLLAGSSWIDEYGSPEVPEERAWLERLSPYHNVDADADHPEIFLLTSTKDDRVHPAHARKMARRLEDLGKPFLYYENIDGGHSAAANRKEKARRMALEFTWLASKLIGPAERDGGQ